MSKGAIIVDGDPVPATEEVELIVREETINLPAVKLVENMLECVRQLPVIKPEHAQFLVENKERFQDILQNTFIWRTKQQKLGILSDGFHPTLHSKFHQAILECKVFFEQVIGLAKDFAMLQCDVEGLQLDIEASDEALIDLAEKFQPDALPVKKEELKKKKLQIELQHKAYQAQQLQIQMNYRMKELLDWKELQDQLITAMTEQGYTMEQIWDKESGEIESEFFLFLGNLKGLRNSTDSAEVNNLVGLARHGVEQAKAIGKYEEWIKKCTGDQLQGLVSLGVETKASLGRIEV